jgi:hypothetical protein
MRKAIWLIGIRRISRPVLEVRAGDLKPVGFSAASVGALLIPIEP